MVGSIIPAAIHEENAVDISTEYYVDYVLIAPYDPATIFIQYWPHTVHPTKLPHPGQIHEHNARIQSIRQVVWMPGKTTIPIGGILFTFERGSRQLCLIHSIEK
ncbi:hypothetical protein BLA29_003364 [Euroglyphus maynei]|uniref:Uncharacterized protein n=1 Tax=Euroglyphus maynei TaxID=6958 RepID=A0A1Y3BHR1_EURMA|nr:hypothetical protein BLA29_003364 [Euroglyphus maynei]